MESWIDVSYRDLIREFGFIIADFCSDSLDPRCWKIYIDKVVWGVYGNSNRIFWWWSWTLEKWDRFTIEWFITEFIVNFDRNLWTMSEY